MFLGAYKHAEDYEKDNVYIERGYRINFNTPKKIFKSLFMLHNEFVNIWTHLIGAVFILCIVAYFAIYIKGRIPGYLPFMRIHFH